MDSIDRTLFVLVISAASPISTESVNTYIHTCVYKHKHIHTYQVLITAETLANLAVNLNSSDCESIVLWYYEILPSAAALSQFFFLATRTDF